jgi:N-methylhydantoinase B
MPGGNQLEYADVEILEAAYPVLFRERRATTGFHGYGRFRSGAGCQESFEAHGTDTLVGNMTGTRAWFPTAGSVGGYPGATMHFAVRRADGQVEPVGIHAVGVALGSGDRFEMMCASGGGYGDPLDRDPGAVLLDVRDERVDLTTARNIYGVVFAENAEIDLSATHALRDAMRRERLRNAAPAKSPVGQSERDSAIQVESAQPLYPGVLQCGRFAVSEDSGTILAIAPGNWLDGCPVLDMPIDDRAGGIVARAHLEPVTGRMLYVDVLRSGDGPSIDIRPERWMRLACEKAGVDSRLSEA